ncbi:MAG: hypothetical protein WCI89_02270 [bacterium]
MASDIKHTTQKKDVSCLWGACEATLPAGFVPRYLWPEYMPECDIDVFLRPQVVPGVQGAMRWGRWPVYFEQYLGDAEPEPNHPTHNPDAPARIVRWIRLDRTDIPPGWKQWSDNPYQMEGFVDISGRSDFVPHWSRSVRTMYRHWEQLEASGDYTLVPLTYEAFAAGYKKSSVAKRTMGASLDSTTEKIRRGSKHVRLWGVLHAGKVIAGMSALDSPTCSSSYYIAGFIQPEAEEVPAMIGLMHHWHTSSAQEGIAHLHFGLFWHPGQPRAWKGFSAFKRKFGLTYVAYQPALYKFMGKNKI